MLPELFPILRASSEVTDIIGLNPVRCYRHGSAPQGVTAPYVTWYVVSGIPENSISELPRVDNYSIQIDCWSDNTGSGSTGVETLATAVRDAVEPYAHMTAVSINDRDPETMRFRIGMTFTFWHRRPSPPEPVVALALSGDEAPGATTLSGDMNDDGNDRVLLQ